MLVSSEVKLERVARIFKPGKPLLDKYLALSKEVFRGKIDADRGFFRTAAAINPESFQNTDNYVARRG